MLIINIKWKLHSSASDWHAEGPWFNPLWHKKSEEMSKE